LIRICFAMESDNMAVSTLLYRLELSVRETGLTKFQTGTAAGAAP